MKVDLHFGQDDEADSRELQKWLKAKEGLVGGSSAAAAAGIGRYGSRLRLWAEMTGQQDPEDVSHLERVRWGNLLEPVVLRELEERTDYRLARYEGPARLAGSFFFKQWPRIDQELYVDPREDWRCYSPDGFVRNGGGDIGLAEIKTTAFFNGKDWDEEPPEEAIIQVQHGLAVLGLNWAVVAALIGGQDFRVYRVERDQELIDVLTEAERVFVEHVRSGRPPELEDPVHPDTLATLKKLHPKDSGETVLLPHESEAWHAALVALKQSKKTLDDQIKAYETRFRNAMEDATFGIVPGTKITYSLKTTERAAYKVDATSYRTLRFKEEE